MGREILCCANHHLYTLISVCIYGYIIARSLSLSSLSLTSEAAAASSALLYFVFPLHRRVCPPLLSDVASVVVEHDRLLAPSVAAHYYFRDNDEAQHMSVGGSRHLPGPTM